MRVSTVDTAVWRNSPQGLRDDEDDDDEEFEMGDCFALKHSGDFFLTQKENRESLAVKEGYKPF